MTSLVIPGDIPTYLAWQFDSVLPGNFRRNKREYAHIAFPIIAPLPPRKTATQPLEGALVAGPFIYFVLDRANRVCYVGKSKEKTVIKRWVRPGVGGPATHYWTHTNESAGCVRRIASGIEAGEGPFRLRFVALGDIPLHYREEFARRYANKGALEQAELGLVDDIGPAWNC